MNLKLLVLTGIVGELVLNGFVSVSYAQVNPEVRFGSGIIWYQGDLSEKMDKIFSKTSLKKPFVTVGIAQALFSRSKLSLNYIYGNLEADDARATELDNRLRNQNFKTVLHEFSARIEFFALNLHKRPFLNPFIYAGAGIFKFNPKGSLNGVWYELQPLGTEGQNITEVTAKAPYKLTRYSFPFGIGIAFNLDPHWQLRVDYAHHFTNTDYLDDVSTVYPDSALLASAPYGQLTVALSNKRLEDSYPEAGRSRGNSKMNDSYSHIGVTLVYNLSSGGKRNSARGGFFGLLRRKHMLNVSCPGF
ncbi:MAG: DUF6089 family protein [Bacteroidia bacterium]|nr:hypothetical protein [Bacteroidia bacterium]MCZ2276723.1 DUF6089 family protein [Bacteroidia bacterium]